MLAAQLWHDLAKRADAVRAGEQAADLGASLLGLALARSAALMGAHTASLGLREGAVPEGDRIAAAIDARAVRERLPGRGTARWSSVERTLDDWMRKTGVAVRRRVEGPAFDRFMTTEAKFCDEERRSAMGSFDLSQVPPDLRHLAALAQTVGVGDDACRGVFLRSMTKAARRTAVAHVLEAADRIDRWLDGLTPPHEGAAAAFYWLRVAAEEMASGD